MPYKTRCKTGQNWCKSSCHEVASEFFATNAPDPPHWTLNSCSGAFHTNLVHLGLFGWITKTRCKTGLQVQKFELPSRVGILRNERNQSSELDSKLLFLCVLFYLGAFGTVWLPYSVQNGQNWCKSSCHEVTSEFFATNATDRWRTGNDLRDQADLASTRSVTTGSWFSDCIGASGSLVVVGS